MGDAGKGSSGRARLRVGGLLGASLLVVVASWWFTTRGSEPATPIRNIVLISIDTCRADHFGAYGFDGPGLPNPTPNLDALAREGILFRSVVSPIPMTLPAHCSMMTGVEPCRHGVHDNLNYRLDPEHETLAELLRDRGFVTGAILGAFVLNAQFGLSQGFTTYDDEIGTGHASHGINERKGDDVTRRAIDWIESHREEQFFLFVHYFDPHDGYVPPEPFASQFKSHPYTGEIAFVDHCIGQVLERLKALDLYDSTLIAVTADHGEMLGEHGEATHSFFVYRSALRVPMIWKLPGRREAGVVAGLAGIIDVMPTVCGLLGIERPHPIEGVDLSPAFDGDDAVVRDRHLYCESVTPLVYDANALVGVVSERWKYIHTKRPELYDLAADPGEQQNLIDAHPDRARLLHKQLEHLLSSGIKQAGADVAGRAEAAQRLGALGYTSGAGPAQFSLEANPDLDDAKDVVGLNARNRHIAELIARGEYAEATVLCEALLADRPTFFDGHQHLAGIAVAQGNLAAAVPHLRRALALKPDDANTLNNLGNALLSQRDFEEAAGHFERALKVNPDFVVARANLGIAMQSLGRSGEAIRHLDRVVRRAPRHADARRRLGLLLTNAGRETEAVVHLKEAVRLNPDSVLTLSSLAWLLAAHSSDEIRDGTEAVRLAERAVRLSARKDVLALDALGAAHAEARQFPQAIHAAEAALRLIGPDGPGRAKAIRQRLARYRAGKPFRVESE